MIQKLILPFDTATGVKFKEGDILVYNEKNQYFYKTTKENLFFKEQQERKAFVDKMEEYVKSINKTIEEMKNNYVSDTSKVRTEIDKKINEVDIYMNKMSNSYNEFLNEFKETNTKLIEMVEKVI